MSIGQYRAQLKRIENKFNDYQKDLDNIIDRVSSSVANTVITKGKMF